LQKANIGFIMSVHPHGTAQLPLKGFSWNLIVMHFLKICWTNSSLFKFWQDYWVLYLTPYVALWYLTELFLE
jgi:hypothetical protein